MMHHTGLTNRLRASLLSKPYVDGLRDASETTCGGCNETKTDQFSQCLCDIQQSTAEMQEIAETDDARDRYGTEEEFEAFKRRHLKPGCVCHGCALIRNREEEIAQKKQCNP